MLVHLAYRSINSHIFASKSSTTSSLAEHGIRCDGHAARQMTRKDYEEFGYLIGMDRMNLSNMARICGGDPEGKCSLLLAHAGQSSDVADPWYTGDFEATWQDVNIGCRALLKELTEKK